MLGDLFRLRIEEVGLSIRAYRHLKRSGVH